MPLAPYHMSVKTVSRAKGRSATAACAYRSGERIEDRRTGQVFDYSRRGGVERAQCEIFAPAEAPAWVRDRSVLWNEAEAAENRKNSTVAREFEIALPADLDEAERRELVRQFAGALVERHGLVVDASIHSPDADAGKGQGNRNHHAHVLCTTRRIGPEGFGAKTRELDDQRSGEVEHWREGFATMCGDALERGGFIEQAARWRAGYLDKAGQIGAAQERGDEAFIAENKDRVPTKHFGPNIRQIEAKGVVTERGEKAREPERMNAEVIDLAAARARIAAEREQAERAADPAPTGTRLLDAARGDRRGTGLLDVPLPAAPRAPEIVLREWKATTDRQFAGVQQKASRVDAYARQLLARHDRRREQHRQARPAEPTGLFAATRRRAYEVAAKAWEQTRAVIQKRIDRLASHIDRIAGYMRRSTAPDGRPSPGEALAQRKAEAANPALAIEARAATGQQRSEQQERDAQQLAQATARRHHHHHGQEQGMAKEGTGNGITSADAQRRAAEGRATSERDGRLAGALSDSIEGPSAAPRADGREIADRMAGKAPNKGAPAKTDQERRVEEARERIRAAREKEREDRTQGKDRERGRGR